MIDHTNAIVYYCNTNLNPNDIILEPKTGDLFSVGESEKLN